MTTTTDQQTPVIIQVGHRAPARIAGDTRGCPPGLAVTPAVAIAGPRLLRWTGQWTVTHLGSGYRVVGGWASGNPATAVKLADALGRLGLDWATDPRGWSDADRARVLDLAREFLRWQRAEEADAELAQLLEFLPAPARPAVHGIVTGAIVAWRWLAGQVTARLAAERLRWPVAYAVDRLPGSCWTSAVSWALGGDDPDGYPWWQPYRSARTCRSEAAEIGCCYCGKFRDLTEPAAGDPWTAQVDAADDAMPERAR